MQWDPPAPDFTPPRPSPYTFPPPAGTRASAARAVPIDHKRRAEAPEAPEAPEARRPLPFPLFYVRIPHESSLRRVGSLMG